MRRIRATDGSRMRSKGRIHLSFFRKVRSWSGTFASALCLVSENGALNQLTTQLELKLVVKANANYLILMREILFSKAAGECQMALTNEMLWELGPGSNSLVFLRLSLCRWGIS